MPEEPTLITLNPYELHTFAFHSTLKEGHGCTAFPHLIKFSKHSRHGHKVSHAFVVVMYVEGSFWSN
jgi:hypothetical protein